MRGAGQLKEIIKVYCNDIVKDDYGQEVEEKKLKYVTKAKINHNSGNRSLENNEIVHNYNKSFTVRYYVPVDDYDIIEWKNNYYRVLDIEPYEEYQYKVINTEKIND